MPGHQLRSATKPVLVKRKFLTGLMIGAVILLAVLVAISELGIDLPNYSGKVM